MARNLLGQVTQRVRGEVARELKALFGAESAAQARALAGELAARWRSRHPARADRLDMDLESCLAYYAFAIADSDDERAVPAHPGTQTPRW